MDDNDQSYSKIESDAFQMLFDSIRSDLFTSPRNCANDGSNSTVSLSHERSRC